MEVLTSRTSSSSSLASTCSTTRATELSRPRTTRPYPVGSLSSVVNRVAAASEVRC